MLVGIPDFGSLGEDLHDLASTRKLSAQQLEHCCPLVVTSAPWEVFISLGLPQFPCG